MWPPPPIGLSSLHQELPRHGGIRQRRRVAGRQAWQEGYKKAGILSPWSSTVPMVAGKGRQAGREGEGMERERRNHAKVKQRGECCRRCLSALSLSLKVSWQQPVTELTPEGSQLTGTSVLSSCPAMSCPSLSATTTPSPACPLPHTHITHPIPTVSPLSHCQPCQMGGNGINAGM